MDTVEVTVTVSITMKIGADDGVSADAIRQHIKDHPGDIQLAAEKCVTSNSYADAGWIDDNTPAYIVDVVNIETKGIK